MPNPFGPLYSIDFIVLVICAIGWYKAAALENIPQWSWAGLSVFVYTFTWLYLHWGIPLCLLGQAGLMIVVAIIRVWIEARAKGN